VAKKAPARHDKYDKFLADHLHSTDPDIMALCRGFAARMLNVQPDADFLVKIGTPLEMKALVDAMLAATSLDHGREVTDRVAPKPKRIEVSGPNSGPVRVAIGAVALDQNEAAKQYFDVMSGAAQLEAADEVDELLK